MRTLNQSLKYLILIVAVGLTVFPIWWIFSTSLETLQSAFQFPAGLIPRGDWQNYIAAKNKRVVNPRVYHIVKRIKAGNAHVVL